MGEKPPAFAFRILLHTRPRQPAKCSQLSEEASHLYPSNPYGCLARRCSFHRSKPFENWDCRRVRSETRSLGPSGGFRTKGWYNSSASRRGNLRDPQSQHQHALNYLFAHWRWWRRQIYRLSLGCSPEVIDAKKNQQVRPEISSNRRPKHKTYEFWFILFTPLCNKYRKKYEG